MSHAHQGMKSLEPVYSIFRKSIIKRAEAINRAEARGVKDTIASFSRRGNQIDHSSIYLKIKRTFSP